MDAARSTAMAGLALWAGLGAGGAASAGSTGTPAARIVAEWEPGLSATEVGGRITVDGYGVAGLGAYALALDGGAPVLTVCVQADVGHSLAADYAPDPVPRVASRELDYLLWRYLGRGAAGTSDVEAAAVNALSWRYANAQRSTGGPVWDGDEVAIAAIGRGLLADVEAAVARLAAEAAARRGPWALGDLGVEARPDGDVEVSVHLRGPGGPIGGVAVEFDVDSVTVVAATNDDGVASVRPPGNAVRRVVASARAPGPAVTYSAHRSQRVAAPGAEVSVRAELVVPPSPTTTTSPPPPTSTTTTTLPTTTTTTTTTSTTPTTTTSTTSTTTTSMSAAPVTAAPPAQPTLPATGTGTRDVARWAAWLVLAGSLAVLAAARRPTR